MPSGAEAAQPEPPEVYGGRAAAQPCRSRPIWGDFLGRKSPKPPKEPRGAPPSLAQRERRGPMETPTRRGQAGQVSRREVEGQRVAGRIEHQMRPGAAR